MNVMPVSPHEKLKALEDVLRKKEQEKKEADKKARKTEEELNTLKAALRAEQDEMLFEEELVVRERFAPEAKKPEEQPESQPDKQAFSIDSLVQDAPPKQQLGGALYALQERMRGGMNLYEMTQTAQALTSLRQDSALTQNQYNILNQFEEQLRERGAHTDYSRQEQLYAQQATNVVDDIKRQMGVKIGDSYVNNDDFML